jgi:hypothetical protein
VVKASERSQEGFTADGSHQTLPGHSRGTPAVTVGSENYPSGVPRFFKAKWVGAAALAHCGLL